MAFYLALICSPLLFRAGAAFTVRVEQQDLRMQAVTGIVKGEGGCGSLFGACRKSAQVVGACGKRARAELHTWTHTPMRLHAQSKHAFMLLDGPDMENICRRARSTAFHAGGPGLTLRMHLASISSLDRAAMQAQVSTLEHRRLRPKEARTCWAEDFGRSAWGMHGMPSTAYSPAKSVLDLLTSGANPGLYRRYI